eukprot:g2782.t1
MPKKGKKGAKKSEAKLKKELRKQELAEEQAMRAHLAEAKFGADGTPRDVLADFAPFKAFDRNGLAASLEFHSARSMPAELTDWVFDLTERNMKALYESSDWGWKAKEKRDELFDENARYLVARAKGEGGAAGEPLAYIHFRFEMMDLDLVEMLYVYDVQLEEGARRKGLGKHLMLVMELAARKWGMDWVMCTVFKHNPASMGFFTKLGYEIDDTSPSLAYAPTMPEAQVDYEILSKPMDRGFDRSKSKAASSKVQAKAPLGQAAGENDVGADWVKISKGYSADSKEMCCGLCDAHDECVVSTWAGGQCYLKAEKDQDGGAYSHKGVVSCAKKQGARPAAAVLGPRAIGPTNISAAVPGDILADLQRAGLIGDPLFGLNFLDSSIWTANTWTYRTTFDAPATAAGGVKVRRGAQARLWWPAGKGAQPLYNTTVTFTPAGAAPAPVRATRCVGFCTFALVTGNDTDPAYVARAASEEGTESLGMSW